VSTSQPAIARARPVEIIEPAGRWPRLRLDELWEYRDLLFFLVWREIKVRYKQAFLGVAWAVIQPLLTTLIFTVIFSVMADLGSDGKPYPLFSFCGLLPWQLFAFALSESANSLVANQRVITKVYFPRIMVPLAAVCVGLADFVVSAVVLGLMMAWYRTAPTSAIWTLPLWTLLTVATAFAMGLWLSALNVRYRDVRYTLPFLTQVWLYATPIAYPISHVPAAWRPLYALNPMVGVVEGFRWALLGTEQPPVITVLISGIAIVALLVGGLFYFQRTERTFADVV
jgi:lipopolysaccharide transport system permease protein